jgi:hypothetical protein
MLARISLEAQASGAMAVEDPILIYLLIQTTNLRMMVEKAIQIPFRKQPNTQLLQLLAGRMTARGWITIRLARLVSGHWIVIP